MSSTPGREQSGASISSTFFSCSSAVYSFWAPPVITACSNEEACRVGEICHIPRAFIHVICISTPRRTDYGADNRPVLVKWKWESDSGFGRHWGIISLS
jgi:hypothetical protein